MKLHFDAALCVRAKSKVSECEKCILASPDTIRLEENLPAFSHSAGVESAACIGACPTEAFSLSDFSTTEFFFSFLESKVRIISAGMNIPCVSVLSVEHFISLALSSEESIVVDLNGYQERQLLYGIIEARIDEANFILSSFCEKNIETNVDETLEKEQNETQVSSRRDFLSTATIKGAVKQKRVFDDAVQAEELQCFSIDSEMISKIRDKTLPNKRKILFTTLKRVKDINKYETLAKEDVSFVSQKYVDESCTNCQICYRVCPTGALSSNGKFSLIHFDAMLCLKCHLCHDVCESDSIHLQDGFETKEFFEPTQRVLATFDSRRCDDCGAYFTYVSGEQLCSRCLVEEEEAIFLHANAKKMKNSDEA